MGNEHSRCKFDKGYICVQTGEQFYYPGQMIQGSIYLRVNEPVEARHIEIKVKGKEKSKFIETVRRHREGGEVDI